MQTAKLGPTIDELIRELSAANAGAAPSAATASQGAVAGLVHGTEENRVRQGLPEGVTVVYEDRIHDFIIQTGESRSQLPIKEAYGVERLRLSPDGKLIAYSVVRCSGILRRDFASHAVLMELGGRKIRDIKDACDPVFSPDGSCVSYLSRKGIFAVGVYADGVYRRGSWQIADIGKRNGNWEITDVGKVKLMAARAKQMGSTTVDSYDARVDFWTWASERHIKLHDWRTVSLLASAHSYNQEAVIINCSTGNHMLHHYLLSLSPEFREFRISKKAGVQLSLQSDKLYFAAYQDTQNPSGVLRGPRAILAYDLAQGSLAEVVKQPYYLERARMKFEPTKFEPTDLRLSSDGNFLGYALEDRIELLDLRTQEVWRLQGATAPFDIK